MQCDQVKSIEATFGDPVTAISQVSLGDLLFAGSYTDAGVPNIMRVARWNFGPDKTLTGPALGFYARFVDPLDPTKARQASDHEFHVWADDLERQGVRATSICDPARKIA